MALIDIILNKDQTEGTTAVLSQWLCAEGDMVEKNQPLLEIETDKVMMEIIAPVSGKFVTKILDTGDEVVHSKPIGKIDDSVIQARSDTPKPIKKDEEIIQNIPEKQLSIKQNKSNSKLISPAVRRLINKHQLNINDIIGSGKNNRITSRDIAEYLKNPQAHNNAASQHTPISNMRRSIANHMVDSLLHKAPHVTSVFNLDLSAIIKHRKLNKENYKQQGIGLTFTSYFIAASVLAIKHQPLINSQLHEETIEVFNHLNIGVGTALEGGGLIVPVLKNCEQRDLMSVANELTQLTQKARNNQLKPADVQNGTFTISNHGVSGSLIATPIIINQPQSAILGIGKMEKRVVVKEINGEDVMMIKPMCYVTLTIDHRVLDAQQCNHFLSVFVDVLESWQ
jgi:2-oxoglutarate dehydrogenase E2 component (dihydrolipoamide succinyltransferase)